MVIGSPDAVLFDTIILAVMLDASNANCQNPISVTWTANNAISYQLERRINGGAWAVVYTGSGLSFGENGSPGTYEYRVKAIRGSQFIYSNIDSVVILAQGLLNQFCSGYDLYGTYRNGCTTSNQLIQALSPSCGVVWGCTDPAATNYNANATHSDNSCIYPPTADFTGHWWNGLTGTGERHWYLTQADGSVTGNHTSRDLFGTIFAFDIISCTVNPNNPLSATGTKQQTSPDFGDVSSANFYLNQAKSEMAYNNQIYTRVG